MSALSQKFEDLRSRNERALVLFVTAGDPAGSSALVGGETGFPISQLPAILDALAEGGADVIEVGIPFSDPIADGPTIQASSQRALERGTTLDHVLEDVRGFDRTPLVLMGYYNTLLRRGLSRAATDIATSGASGTIISDLTPEEAQDWISASHSNGLENIFLAAPTSTDARLDIVCGSSSGFVYALSRTGVTGAQNQASDASTLVGRIRSRTTLPVCVGFGISKPEHVRTVCSFADGAVIGSWLVDWLAKNWEGGAGRNALIEAVRGLKSATLVNRK